MFKKLIIINNPDEINIKRIKKFKAQIILREKKSIKINSKVITLLKKNNIKFFVYNDIKRLFKYKSNFFYISSKNHNSFKHLKLINKHIFLLGGAHNVTEIYRKINQGCDAILLSRIFKSDEKKGFLDLHKFNNLLSIFPIKVYALGGINRDNIKKIRICTRSIGACIMSAYKNKNFNFQ